MTTRPYGPTGETTTTIGLGGAFLTASSFEDGVATVRRALDLGVRYFDTSPMYCRGAAQAVVGQALDGTTEPHLLATKLSYFARRERFHSHDALVTQF
ncbi:MAG TPA: aldo/keto reductase, partial [Spirochaetia bacterium]|nr:aldo/keto reductase [Spirochaetia bacterium]